MLFSLTEESECRCNVLVYMKIHFLASTDFGTKSRERKKKAFETRNEFCKQIERSYELVK